MSIKELINKLKEIKKHKERFRKCWITQTKY